MHAPRGHFEVLSEKRDAIGLVVIVLILGRPTAADVVTPREVKFEFEVTEDQVAKACHLLVLMVNYPNPEAVNFKVVFTFEKRTDHAFYGFIVDVGDAHYRNGQFAGMEHVPLDAAEFLSPTFNSTGRFHMNVGDSGVFGSTADLETASAFLRAVMAGNFEISFRRRDSVGFRTYLILSAPLPGEFQKFLGCAATYR